MEEQIIKTYDDTHITNRVISSTDVVVLTVNLGGLPYNKRIEYLEMHKKNLEDIFNCRILILPSDCILEIITDNSKL